MLHGVQTFSASCRCHVTLYDAVDTVSVGAEALSWLIAAIIVLSLPAYLMCGLVMRVWQIKLVVTQLEKNEEQNRPAVDDTAHGSEESTLRSTIMQLQDEIVLLTATIGEQESIIARDADAQVLPCNIEASASVLSASIQRHAGMCIA